MNTQAFISTRKRSAAAVFILLFTITMLSACEPSPETVANGDDPMEALKVPVQSTRYTGDFWMRDYERDPARFMEAVAFCEEKEFADYPNCREVMRAQTTIQALESPRLEGKTYSGQSTAPPRLEQDPDSTNQP